jgi:hypothetical protein
MTIQLILSAHPLRQLGKSVLLGIGFVAIQGGVNDGGTEDAAKKFFLQVDYFFVISL